MDSKNRQAAARLGDKDTGHPGAPPTPIITGSPDVLINGKPAARLGDKLQKHHKGERRIVEGVNSVLINGLPAVRISDAINCGGVINEGSPNVFIGDKPKLTPPITINLPKIVFPRERQTATPSEADFSQSSGHTTRQANDPVILQQDQQAECMRLAAGEHLPFIQGTQ
ncbi:MAG: PAAR domain-containing protein [Cellvibrionaceae bacterium]|nr:PAAR domain-containing protein [Cellvibrionaceae bacterium]